MAPHIRIISKTPQIFPPETDKLRDASLPFTELNFANDKSIQPFHLFDLSGNGL